MYIPDCFAEPNINVLQELIIKYPMGILFTDGKCGLEANHLPFNLQFVEGTLGVLSAHIARKNLLWQNVANGDEVLVVFQAADAYVSPN